MTLEEARDRLETIDQLPEVGPDLVNEASDLLDVIENESPDHDEHKYAASIYRETVRRAVSWNP